MKLADFEELSAQEPDSSPAKLLYSEQVQASQLPALRPFAVVVVTAGSDVMRDYAARQVWFAANAIKADVVIVDYRGQVYAGSVSQYVGFGVATATPVYADVYRGYCYKRAPFNLGIAFNKDGMVVACVNAARSSGIQEGDTLLSVNGLGMIGGENSTPPWYELFKTIRPGDELRLVWIRPGQGRMEGSMMALDNPPAQLALQDSIPWQQ